MRRHRVIRARNRARFVIGLVVGAFFAVLRALNPRSTRC